MRIQSQPAAECKHYNSVSPAIAASSAADTSSHTIPAAAPLRQPVRQQPAPSTGPQPHHKKSVISSMMLPADFVAVIASNGEDGPVKIDLPDGRIAEGSIRHIRRDADGRVLGVEGHITKPVPGYFIFNNEPPQNIIAPISGVIHLYQAKTSYRAEPGKHGLANLVERPIDQIICTNPFPAQIEQKNELVTAYALPSDFPTNAPIPDYQNGVICLQSKPDATAVIYLDFDGEYGPFSAWEKRPDYVEPAEDISPQNIFMIWRNVAEDYAPFNINVTTDLKVYKDAPEISRQRCIITASPAVGPGVSYVGSFNWSGDTPNWVGYTIGKTSSEAIAHECGHAMHLHHDTQDLPDGTHIEYYSGYGDRDSEVAWTPTMGGSYSRNLSQWSKGEYPYAGNTNDDILTIATKNNSVGYRPDDLPDTTSSATHLNLFSDGKVDDDGIIDSRDDVDAFSFSTTGGSLQLHIYPDAPNPDVDLLAEIRTSSNSLILAANPDLELDAWISTNLPAGDYVLMVSGVGRGDVSDTNENTRGYTDYASMGFYGITGTIAGAVSPQRFSIDENPAPAYSIGFITPETDHGTNTLSFQIVSGNDKQAVNLNLQTGELTVNDSSQFDYETLAPTWFDTAMLEMTVLISDQNNTNQDEHISVVIDIQDINESPTIDKASAYSFLIPQNLIQGTQLATFEITEPDHAQTHHWEITSGNSLGYFCVNGLGYLCISNSPAQAGTYPLQITATDSGDPALSDSISVTVEVFAVSLDCKPGELFRTVYDDIPGNDVSNLTNAAKYPHNPDREISLHEMAHDSIGDSYGSTIRAYLIAPYTADYTFWVASNGSSELWLSSDTNTANANLIAHVNRFTGFKEWDEYDSQKSAPAALEKGKAYYIEVLQKEDIYNDHVAVAWQITNADGTTNITRETIPVTYLAPHTINYYPHLTNQTVSVYESTLPGIEFARMQLKDLNRSQSYHFEITGGNDDGAFSIDSASGSICVNTSGLLNATNQPTRFLNIYVSDNGTPSLSATGSLAITVIPADHIATTNLIQEMWFDIPGTEMDDLYADPRWPTSPDSIRFLQEFDSGTYVGSEYGSRICAYLTPPTSGIYNFYVAANNNGELFLSTDESPSNSTRIAYTLGSTLHLEWDKYQEQKSVDITLSAGQRYYIEARNKEGHYNDHIAVGWTTPNNSNTNVISLEYLKPYNVNLPPDFSSNSYNFVISTNASNGFIIGTINAAVLPFESLKYGNHDCSSNRVFVIDPDNGNISLRQSDQLIPGKTFSLDALAQDDGYGGILPPAASTAALTIQVSGTPLEQWKYQHFGDNAIVPSISGNQADPENDGIINLTEYALLLDPLQPPDLNTPYAALPEIEVDASNRISMVYRQNIAATDITYLLQQTTNMIPENSWLLANTTNSIISDDGKVRTIRATLTTTNQPPVFLRLQIQTQ